jgi:hypothetical protein
MPVLVPEKDLLVANSITSVAGTVSSFVGLVAGTQVATSIGTRGLLVVCAAAWPLSSYTATKIQSPLRAIGSGLRFGAHLKQTAVDLGRGARRLKATPPALGSIISISVDQFLIGAITVLSVILFKQEFKQGVASYGRIIGAGGVGVLVGGLTVGWFEDRLANARIVSLSFAIAGLVCAGVAAHIVGPTILVVTFTLGLTYPWRKVPADTIVQKSIPDRFRGRVFALYDMAFALPRVMAAGLAVLFIPRMSKATILFLAGLVYLLWVPVLPWWVRRRRTVGVLFYAGGSADEVPRAVVIGGEEERVEVLGSWIEEITGGEILIRQRRFRLRSSDGTVMEIAGQPAEGPWRLEREVPSDTATPQVAD